MPGGQVALQMVSPSEEHGFTVNTPGGQTVQLIFPLPGQTTPGGQGKEQFSTEAGNDHVFAGQKRRVETEGQ